MTVAIITAVSGKAWVKDAEGNLRVAQEGDALLAGEVLITADGASVGLAFMDGRPPVVIGEATQVAMVMELGEGDLTSSLALESADVAAIIDLLESAEGDLLDALEEPAAGEAGAAGPGGEGHSFVRLLRIVEDVDPLAFEFNQARLDDIAVRDGQGAGAQSDSDQPVSLTGLDGSDPGVPGTPENPPVNPSTDPGTPDNSGNPNSPADDDYAAAFSGAEQAVWESGLADGSTPSSSLVTRSGSFGFSTPDGLQALVIGDSGPLDIARLQGLSSNPLTVETPLGTLLLTGFTGDESSGSISYTYILSENVDNDSAPGARDEGALDSISVTVTDADGSTATGSLDIAIIDDVPAAADDATTTDEDTPVTVDVIANDIRGADGAVVTDASLLDSSQGSVVLNEDGTVTFTPAPGFEGDALIEYTLTDGDGDTSQATLTVTVAGDSTPETVIPPGEPGDPGTPPEPADPDNPEYPGDPGDPSDNIDLAAGDSLRVVDEAGLSDGSNADADTEMATGTFAIDTKGDSLQSLVINGTDVTAAGSGGISVSGEYGTLTVTETDGTYSWSYTLDASTTDHSTVDSTAIDNVRDIFNLTVTDSDGDTDQARLGIDVKDDVPTAVDDSAETAEDTAITVDVLANDTRGADGASVTGATVSEDLGSVVVNDDGTLTFTPAAGVEGDVVIDYTLTDADGDTSTARLTVNVAEDSTPEIVIPPGEPGDPSTPTPPSEPGDPETPEYPGDPEDPSDDIDLAAGDSLRVVDEAGLSDGSDAEATTETTSGTFAIDTKGDSLQSLVINDTDVTTAGGDGLTVQGEYGTLTVTESGGEYQWSYTLDASTTDHDSQGPAIDNVRDIFNLTVTDSDGDTEQARLGIDVKDDVPTAVDDTAEAAEDSAVTVDVLANDTRGADGASVTKATVSEDLGSVVVNENGTITFTPAAGVEGDVVIDYTLTDADGDTSTARLTVTVAADSTPEIVIPPGEPGDPGTPPEPADPENPEYPGDPEDPSDNIDLAAGDSLRVVDEAGLSDGSDAEATTETTSGTFDIRVGSDDLSSVVINGTPVTEGGTVQGKYGTLTVTESGGEYQWSYTLDSSTTDHASEGPAIDNVRDLFNLEITDSDGDTDQARLGIDVKDDVPTAVDDSAETAEDTAITVDVLANDTRGADGASVTGATVSEDLGSVVVNDDGTLTFTPAAGVEGDVVIDYTLTDADGDTSTARLTVNVAEDSTPEIVIPPGEPGDPSTPTPPSEPGDPETPEYPGDPEDPSDDIDLEAGDSLRVVDEAGLSDGSDAEATTETTSGTFAIDTKGDSLQSLVINGTDVTTAGSDGISVSGEYGTLTVSESGGEYQWSYTLDDSTTDHESEGPAIDNVRDLFNLTVTDSDGDTDQARLGIDVKDDVPTAVDDSAETAEDSAVTYNVLSNNDDTSDTQGADGATLTAASLRDDTQGTVSIAADGNVTFTPAPGVEGDVVIDYTITDADGDTSSATLTVNVAEDSTPEIVIPPGEPEDPSTPPEVPEDPENPEYPGDPEDPSDDIDLDAGDSLRVVDEAGLSDGSNADADTETTSGTFAIDTKGDSLQSVVINGTDVTAAGSDGITVNGEYGTLTVTETDGTYSWSYTLDASTTDHSTVDSTAIDNVRDIFNLEVTDSDGDTDQARLGIDVKDDVPTAVDDTAEAAEDTAITVDVLANDIRGADGASVTAATVSEDLGNVVINEDGTLTFTPKAGFEGDAVISYTLTDADGDTSSATLTVTVAEDSTPEIVIPPGEPEDPGTPPEVPGDPENPEYPGDPEDPNDDIDLDAGDSLRVVDEAGLSDGSNADATTETTSGTFAIDTKGDSLQSVVINGTDVTAAGSDGITINGEYGTLTVTESGGEYRWSYTLDASTTDHSTVDSTAIDNVRDIFNLEVTDSDGDTDQARLGIDVKDDVPTAVDDTAEAAEDTAITVDVLGNDTRGADGASVTAATVSEDQGSVVINEDGTLTFTPNKGVEGEVVIDYTITDADGDTSNATLTVNVAEDSTPDIVIPPGEPEDPSTPPEVPEDPENPEYPGDPEDPSDDIDLDAGDSLRVVDEAGLSDGSNADADTETTSGTFAIDTKGDTLTSLVINGTDVTAAGSDGITVNGEYGTLTVTESGGEYRWSYTLDASTTDHESEGPAIDNVRDIFNLEVTDSDGDTDQARLGIDVKDDVPTAVDDTAEAAEDTAITVDVLANDTRGADGASVTAATVSEDQGSVVINEDGTLTFTPNKGVEGDVVIDYTITDADGDTSSATLTVNVAEDSTPDIVIPPGEPEDPSTPPEVPEDPENPEYPGDPEDPSDDIDLGAGDSLRVVDEAGLSDGSNADADTETTSGTFAIDTKGDSLQSVVINGTDVTAAGSDGITVNGEYGTLTVTESGGEYRWSYTLDASTTDHESEGPAIDNVRDIFNLEVTDSDGDTDQARLGIDVKDDVPTAEDDTAGIDEDTTTALEGDVLPNDTQSADGLGSVAFNDPSAAQFGTFTDNGDGTWSYELDNSLEAVQALDDGETLTESLTYTLTDTDGDTSEATLTITITGQTDAPPTVTPEDSDGTASDAHNSVTEGTGETVTGSVTVSAEAGIAAVTVGGVDVTAAGDGNEIEIATTARGTLTVTDYDAATGVISYRYTEDSDAEDHTNDAQQVDSFDVVVTDVAGESTTGSLTIETLDTEPTAEPDTAGIDEDTTTALEGDVLPNDTQSADGLGSVAFNDPSAAQFGTFTDNGDGTWSYELDNSLEAVQALDDGETLTESLTYTLTDADGDSREATLTITITGQTDAPPTVTPEDSDGTASDAHNSVTEGTGETVTGSVTVSAEAGIAAVTVGGVDVTAAGDGNEVEIATTARGTLTVTDYDAATGVISYRYTEDSDAEDHTNDAQQVDSFDVVVTDVAGESTTGSLTIETLDTEPTAEPDTASIEEDAVDPVTGTVLTNDTQSADGLGSVAFNDPSAAQFGTFTDNGDGSWSYTLDNSLAAVQALDDGETLTESLSYTLTDADGDTSEATLTITITGQTDAPPTVTPEDSDGTASDAHNSVVEGTGETVTGTVTVSAEAGIAAVTVGGVDVTSASDTNQIEIASTDRGTLTVTDYDAATGVISYRYTEDSDAEDHTNDAQQLDSFDVVVTDVAGESTTGSLTIETLDTEPTAEDDTASLAEDTTTALTGDVLPNDTQSADGLGSVAFNDPSAAQFGTFTDNGDGSWSYELDNSLEAVQALDDGETLTESLTYTLTDADGDTSEATLTITITGQTDAPPTVTPEDSDGTASDAHNSVTEGTGETVTGSVTVSAEAGIAAVTVGGVDVTAAGDGNEIEIATTARGTLTVTDYDAATGVISYRYTEDSDAEDHTNDAQQLDSFDVVVTDVAGESTTGTLTVETLDTEPTAVDDTTETEKDTKVTYNVLSNNDGTSDTQGADGATLTAASLRDSTQGTVSFDKNGNVTFTPAAGVEGDVVIDYTITDADDDTSSATLTVIVDSVPTTPDSDGDPKTSSPTAVVDEEGLSGGIAGGGGDVAGEATTVTGNLGYSFGSDGAGSFTWLTSNLPSLTSQGEAVTWAVSEDGLTLTGNAGDREVLKVAITDVANGVYEVTLSDVLDHPTANTEDDIALSVKYEITDGDGSAAQGALDINVDDDSPTASSSELSADGTVNLVGNGGFEGNSLPDGWYYANAPYDSELAVYGIQDGYYSGYSGTRWNSSNTEGFFDDVEPDGNDAPSDALLNVLVETSNNPQALVARIDADPTVDGYQKLSAGNTYDYTFDLGLRGGGGHASLKYSVQLYNADTDLVVETLESGTFASLPSAQEYATFTGSFTAGETANYYLLFKAEDSSSGLTDRDYVIDRVAIRSAGTILDEDGLAGGIAGGEGDVPGEVTQGSGKLNYAFGADGPAESGAVGWLESGQPDLTSGGEPVTWKVTGGGSTLTATASTGKEVLVFELTDIDISKGTAAYSVTLKGPLDHASGSDENDLEFDIVYGVTDADGDTAQGKVKIQVDDDTPIARDDSTTTTEDSSVTHNVLTNDDEGADGATLTEAKLNSASSGAGSVSWTPDGRVTFVPAGGFAGEVLIDYTITDGDGDISSATLTITVGDDSTPVFDSLDGDEGIVDEAGLANGSRAGDGSNISTGTFSVATGGDALSSLTIDGNEVLGGSTTITTDLGTLTVKDNDDGSYDWSYELTDNSTEHSTQGTGIDGVKESFAVVATDSDGSKQTSSLDVSIRDDIPVVDSPDSDLMVPISEQTIKNLSADWVITKQNGYTKGQITETHKVDGIHLGWGSQSPYVAFRFLYPNGANSDIGVDTDSLFSLGTFYHVNNPAYTDYEAPREVNLNVSFTVDIDGVATQVSTTVGLKLTETTNNGTAEQNRDVISITNPSTTQTIQVGDREFVLKVEGFLENGSLVNTVRTYENQSNQYQLYARISSTDDLPILEGTVIDDIVAYGADDPDTDGSLSWKGADANGVVSGQYGELTTADDGSYVYTISRETRDGMDIGDSLIETFTYYVTDQDGDKVEETLEININGLPNGDVAFSEREFDYYNAHAEVTLEDGWQSLPQHLGGAGDDELEGDARAETLAGRAGNDILKGGGGDDLLNGEAGVDHIVGGEGSDQLIGDGTGPGVVLYADTFVWELGDAGATDAPAEDRVLDFTVGKFGETSAADKLSLGDLLEGYDAGTDADQSALDTYIHAEQDGSSTTLYIKSDGGLSDDNSNADQKIKLDNVSMGGQSSHDFLSQMIDQGQLDIE